MLPKKSATRPMRLLKASLTLAAMDWAPPAMASHSPANSWVSASKRKPPKASSASASVPKIEAARLTTPLRMSGRLVTRATKACHNKSAAELTRLPMALTTPEKAALRLDASCSLVSSEPPVRYAQNSCTACTTVWMAPTKISAMALTGAPNSAKTAATLSPKPPKMFKKSTMSWPMMPTTCDQSPPARSKASITHVIAATMAVKATTSGLAATSSMALRTDIKADTRPCTATWPVLNAAKPPASTAKGFHRATAMFFRAVKAVVRAAEISSPVPKMLQKSLSADSPPCI